MASFFLAVFLLRMKRKIPMHMAMAMIGPAMIATRTPVVKVKVTAPALADELDCAGDVPEGEDDAPAAVPLPDPDFPVVFPDSIAL